MNEREKIKNDQKRIPRATKKKRLPRTKGEKQTNKKKLCKLQWRPMTPQSENPTREKKKWREKREKKMARLDFYEARQHEPITKKNGGRVTTLPSSHTPTRREEKKMAGTVGCPRRRQNTNTQVSDNSSRNHTHTKKK